MDAHVYTLEQLENAAAEFAATLTPSEKATVIALQGDLGAGKTTFTQALARALGVTEDIISPTFVIQKQYPLEGQAFKQLVHIDAYRLEIPQQLAVLGWDETIENAANLVVVEWPEHVRDVLPENTRYLQLEYTTDTTRTVRYDSQN